MVVDLPEPFGPRKPVTIPRPNRERQAVDRSLVAVVLRQSLCFDHRLLIKPAFSESFLRRRPAPQAAPQPARITKNAIATYWQATATSVSAWKSSW